MLHGRMLLNGRPSGVLDLNTYDAACVAWAYLEEQSLLHPEAANVEGPQQLRNQIMGTAGSSISELEAMQAEMGGLNGTAPPPSMAEPTRNDGVDDLLDFRRMLEGDSSGS